MIKVSGEVISGKRKGQKLGFPTANIKVLKKLESGVWAGKTIISARNYKSAIFIPEKSDIIESHIFNFSGDIYGRIIKLEIDKKIREAIKFKSNKKLIEQIKEDIRIINHFYKVSEKR